jgi:hypothetical protein
MNRYSNIKQSITINNDIRSKGINYYNTNLYPEIPLDSNDIYVITNFGDRLELLADQFYNDISLYWIIASANYDKLTLGSIFIPEGTQLRIPVNTNEIISSYNQLNSL